MLSYKAANLYGRLRALVARRRTAREKVKGTTMGCFMKRAPFAAAALSAATSAAWATTYCVTCEVPQAQYACNVDAAANAGLQLYCIAELAKTGKHERCAINRSEQSKCSDTATARTLPAPQGLFATEPPSGAENAAAEPPADNQGVAGTGDAPQVSEPNQAEPKTVQDLVEKSGNAAVEGIAKTGEAAAAVTKQTGGALQKAGDAVASAAKKTWTCVTSLFGDC